ncbi:WXG100 family type VII secretion target [Actinoplanes sp. NPDC049265]|uniref:WXG100 family type VII secretion target n=1 Tax=Actinoplanes sp. NPDC049265 TaxID=3363902 RepID=UPI003724117F
MPDAASSKLRVPPELEAAGNEINRQSKEITDHLNDLKKKLMPITESQEWKSQAQTYYDGLQGEWNLAADGLFGETGVLGKIASTLNLSWNNYSECEWQNLKTWMPAGH